MSTELPPMPRFVSDEHDARYEFSVPRTTYEDLRDEYVDLRARLQEEIAEREKVESMLGVPDTRAKRLSHKVEVLLTRVMKEINIEHGARMDAESRAAALQKDNDKMRAQQAEDAKEYHHLREQYAALQKELEAVRKALRRLIDLDGNCDYVDGEPLRCPGIDRNGTMCHWCEGRAALSKESK
jgi:chromosome segregation ATPase